MTFLRWVELLSNFGRIPDAIKRTANASREALANYLQEPFLGGCPDSDDHGAETGVNDERKGYLRHIDMGTLQDIAERGNGVICVQALPGTFVDGSAPIARISFEPNDDIAKEISSALDIGDERTFDQDPAYGISALAEIGVKALSPSVNDPVTAIRVIDRVVRVLGDWEDVSCGRTVRYDRVFVPPLDASRLFAAAFVELALYGATNVNVCVRLQQAFLTLERTDNEAVREAAREQSILALKRARNGLTLENDLQQVEALAAEVS